MKLLGKHWYIVSSPVKISAEKIKALAEGRSHIHADPIRKVKGAAQITLTIAGKEGAHA